MAFPRLFSLPTPLLGTAYLAAYVVLDWVSFIHPFAPYGITPWNPSTGVSFAVVLLFGQRFVPWLFAAPLLADIFVRHLPFTLPTQILTALVIGTGYSLAVLFLLRPSVRFHPSLPTLRDLILLLLVAASSSAAVAIGYGGVLVVAGVLNSSDLVAAALRFWVGDMIGITVVTPFTLLLMARGWLLPRARETALQLLAIAVCLWFVFGYAERHHFQLFYILFLPVVWLAIRAGIEGVTAGLLITQLGVIVGVQMLPQEQVDLVSFQALMLVLTMTGLAAGALVTERRRSEFQLRLHQESIAKLARLGSMGELAALVAHEMNQPLMAAGTYARLVAETLRSPAELTLTEQRDSAADVACKTVAQLDRAADVLRRLRALVRLDQSGRAPAAIERLVGETMELSQPELHRHNVGVRVQLASALPPVLVDALQIEQVMLNIIRNSIEAIESAGQSRGEIVIRAAATADGLVEIEVSDNGPGFPPQFDSMDPPPLSSDKPDGLGIGLALCRSIVESHGGRLAIGRATGGAAVSFTLPPAKVDDD